ncbi:MAG: imidazole glycerol phosphate synthase subunit HisH [Endomicrobiaceae bacterium]|jgi:glutamine amidotransferase|nr:imidazole glycerol phosphate synthase subunit HisH [Endomicrobiaceae bacterium]
MTAKIAIIDYGMGNLRSVSKAIELCKAYVDIISEPEQVKNYNAVVLPGVGSFAPAIKIIKDKGLDIAIKKHLEQKKMFLGICLGFQLLFSKSYEEGLYEGLDIIKGSVEKFIPKPDEKLIIPHIGWNTINISENIYAKQMYRGINNNEFVYFVHSFYCKPEDKKIIATETNYSVDFCSSIATENIWGCQFHPEKSSNIGIAILKNFVSKCEDLNACCN